MVHVLHRTIFLIKIAEYYPVVSHACFGILWTWDQVHSILYLIFFLATFVTGYEKSHLPRTVIIIKKY